jgi:acyl transferase domain-containing protein/phosphopantetheinyl transferase
LRVTPIAAWWPERPMPDPAMRTAIIGLACVFPGAPGLQRFWRNIVDGVDAISDVPSSRWDASFYDPTSSAIDRFYCRRGGFVDDYADFDPLPFGIMPKATEAIEPDQLLTLKIGYQALRDAGYEHKAFARDRTGVIVGRGNYVSAGVLRLEQHVRLLPQLLQTLRDLFPDMPEAALDAARERLQQSFSYYGPDVAAGLIPNLIASRLANRLDLHGPAYTVDAACASSLIAIEQACAALHRDETDMMLVGGAHLSHDLTFWATFCQLGALSRSSTVRPFSKDADGILAGEGVGMAVLKRLEDALADGDRIYAVIEGSGSSSDGRAASLVAPSVSGQRIALEKAWKQAGIARSDIGLVEAHGTGTPTGDAIELETLAQFFGAHIGEDARAVVGSVKSMIGHAMPASGMASLIKTALSIYHGVLPPTLHCEEPHPLLADTRFRVIDRAEPWNTPSAQRVAAVNAFGFGGINAHLVMRGVEQRESAANTQAVAAPSLPALLVLSADTREDLLARLDRGEHDARPQPGRCRLVIAAPDAKRIATARKAVVSGKPWQGRQRIWFSQDGLIGSGGKIAFVFPGVDSTFQPQAADVAAHFGRPLPRYCGALTNNAESADTLAKQVVGLLGLNRLIFDVLGDLGIHADAYAGHSVGEWSAMLCSGMMDQSLSDRTNEGLDLDAIEFPDVLFLSAACSETRLLAAMDGLDRIALSHDNCPHQVIACGARASIDTLAERLRAASVFVQILPFVSGFHSPLFADHMSWYREFFGNAKLVEPSKPVWSATTVQRFPTAMADKRQLALDHLLQPVRFRELTEALYADGCRVFVQVGSGSLNGFIDDTLSGRPHHAVQSNHESRSGLEQLQQLCAALWVEGAEFDTQLLVSTNKIAADVVEPRTASTQRLSLGVPLVRVRQPLEAALLPSRFTESAELPAVAANDAIGLLMRDTLADIERSGREVLAMWQRHRAAPPAPVAAPSGPRLFQRRLDLDSTIPYVRDHELYPQHEHWPITSDRHPVVPMTMEVMLVREAVEEAVPGFKVIEVAQIQAYNWLVVSEPLTVDIHVRPIDAQRFDVEIAGYFKACVVVAAEYPREDSSTMAPLQNVRDTEVDAQALYRERWMFHGPAYQGVSAFRGIGDNGIDGELRVPAGKGALLDNMGQLAGYWVMEQPQDCLAMPIGVDRIRFFSPDPQPGEITRAQVRVAQLDSLNCVSDHQLRDADGRLRIAIDGWRTRRYQMDKAFWIGSRLLSHFEVSQRVPPNVALFDDRYDTAILRDYISRRYLTASERATYDGLAPRRRRQWLAGRVAAKDAVRAWLRDKRGIAAIYPQELRIENDANGAPRVLANITDTVPDTLHVSLSHKGSLAVAIVGERPVGIDIETIEPREESFLAMVFSAAERRLLKDSDAEYARGWVVKEVAAKIAGTGLGGRMRDFVIEARDDDCFRVNGHWIVTHELRDRIVGWSLPHEALPQFETPTETAAAAPRAALH